MTKIFISYRRKSWPFTHRLADDLRARLEAEIFVDFTGIDETDFEKSILRHLQESDVALLVITEETFADRIHHNDDWVRREIRVALERQIPLVLVCVEGQLPPAGLPDDIKDVARMQGINFYPDYFKPAIEKLAEFVTRISPAQLKAAQAVTPMAQSQQSTAGETTEKIVSGKATLDEALDLLEQGDPAKAKFLFEQIKATGYRSRLIDLDEFIRQAVEAEQQAERKRLAQLDYEEICTLARPKITQAQAIGAFQQWQQDYPELWEQLDSQNLRERLATIQPVPQRIPGLIYIDNKLQIQDSLDTFNSDYQQALDLARELLRATTFWVYSPNSRTFGPSKFVGFQNMNFDDYAAARRGDYSGNRFHGQHTHKVIEKILSASYVESPRLSVELKRWGQSLLGPTVFDGVDETKWKFVSL